MPATPVTLVGNLTRQPELRYTATGQATTSFGVAVNRRRQSKGNLNEVTEVVSFFTVIAWGTLAENVSESLEKGARVVVQGRLEQRTWLDKEGERHTVYEVVADEVGASLRWATASVTRAHRSATTDAPPAGDAHADPAAGPQAVDRGPFDGRHDGADDPFALDDGDLPDAVLVPA